MIFNLIWGPLFFGDPMRWDAGGRYKTFDGLGGFNCCSNLVIGRYLLLPNHVMFKQCGEVALKAIQGVMMTLEYYHECKLAFWTYIKWNLCHIHGAKNLAVDVVAYIGHQPYPL